MAMVICPPGGRYGLVLSEMVIYLQGKTVPVFSPYSYGVCGILTFHICLIIMISSAHTFIEKEPCPTEKKKDLTLRRRRMGANFKIFTFIHVWL